MTAEDEARKFWKELIDDENRIGYDRSNRYNMMNMLAGFLQACERLGCMEHPAADALFKEMTDELEV